MANKQIRIVAGLFVLIVAIILGTYRGSQYKLQTGFPTRNPQTPDCRTSQIEVTTGSSTLDVGDATQVYFTNRGFTCQLNQWGPTVAFVHGSKTIFDINASRIYGPRLNGATVLSGYTLYADLLLSSSDGTTSCNAESSNGIVVEKIGKPDESTVRLRLTTNNLCPSGRNLSMYAY